MGYAGNYQLPIVQSSPPVISPPYDILRPNPQTLNEGATMGLVNVRAGNLTFKIGLYPQYKITYDSRLSTFDLEYIHLHKNIKRANLQTEGGYVLAYERDKAGGSDNALGQRYLRIQDGPEDYGTMWVKDGKITVEMRSGSRRIYTEDRRRKETGTDKFFILSSVEGIGSSQVSYEFDDLGQLTAIAPIYGAKVIFSYNDDGSVDIGIEGEEPAHNLTFNTKGDIAEMKTRYRIPYGHSSETVSNGDFLVGYTFHYNDDGRLIKIEDSLGRTALQVSYYPGGKAASVIRPDETWNYSYSGGETTVSFSSPLNASPFQQSVTYSDLGTGTLERIVDCAGNVQRNFYDGNGNLERINDKRGSDWVFTYHAVLRKITSMTSPEGNTWNWGYYPSGLRSFERDPLGNETRWFYDLDGNLTSVVDALGNETIFTYDDRHRVASVTDPEGVTVQYQSTYSGSRLLTKKTIDGEGFVTEEHFTYDIVTGREVVTDLYRPSGGHWRYTYTSTIEGLKRKELIDPFNNVISGSYDPAPCEGELLLAYAYSRDGRCDDCPGANDHRQWTIKSPDSGITMATRDQEGYESAFSYFNFWGRYYLKDFTRYHEPNDRWNHLSCGLFVPDTDRSGLGPAAKSTNSYQYDCRGLLISESDPLGRVTTYTYDGNGNRISKTLPNQKTVSYTYDLENRLTKITYPDGRAENFSYNPNGNLQYALGLDGNLLYEYDSNSRITALHQEVDETVETINYGYDSAGRRVAMIHGDNVWSYTYDRNGRTREITSPMDETAAFQYSSCCNSLSALTLANGMEITYGYDLADRVTDVIHREADGQVIKSFAYARDVNGLTVGVERENPQWSQYYIYDNRLQLKGVEGGDGTSEEYLYDGRGNRTRKWMNGILSESYTYNGADEILEDGSYTYLYEYIDDPVISMVLKKELKNPDSGQEDTEIHSFDYREKMVNWTKSVIWSGGRSWNEAALSYLPDGMGRVGKKSESRGGSGYMYQFSESRERLFVNDFADVLVERERMEGEILGNGTHYYYDEREKIFTHGPGIDNPLSFYLTSTRTPDLDGSYFFGMNAKGDVMSLTDVNGNLTGDYEFDPWGQIIQGDSDLNNVLFAAREYDSEIGLYFNRARYYDPGLGRFTQRDLIFNPSDNFRYVFNMPTIFRDPEGLRPPGPWGGVIVSGGYTACVTECMKDAFTTCNESCVAGGWTGIFWVPCMHMCMQAWLLGCQLGCL